MFTTIIFDLGGVVITPAEKITPFILSEILTINLDVAFQEYNDADEKLRSGEMTVKQFTEAICRKYCPSASLENLTQLYVEYYNKQAIINNAVVKIISSLKPEIQKVALSNMNDLHAKCNQSRGLFNLFNKVYLSSVIGKVKPHIDAYEYVIQDLHITPQNTMYIDDKEENIHIGKSIGFESYLYDTPIQLSAYLQKQGVL